MSLKRKNSLFKLLLMAALAAAPLRAQEGGGPAPTVVIVPSGTTVDAAPAAAPSVPNEAGPAAAPAGGDNADAIPLRDTLGTEVTSDAVIQWDPETDSIIIITDEGTNNQIDQVVRELDKPIQQVLIKVLFLEVTHNRDRDLGVEGSYTSGPADALDTISTNFGVLGLGRGGTYHILKTDLEVTLHALETVGKTEVLSRPSILSRNNQTATITVGKSVPIIQNSRVTDTGQTINTVVNQDVGIILEVTPHITSNRQVEMEVLPEISALTDETVPISDTVDAPVIAKRNAQTNVVAADSQTIVIGGLMQDQDVQTVQKVPFLGDIPWVGLLFRRSVTTKQKTELLIFLTPYVIEGTGALDKMSADETSLTEVRPLALQTPKGSRKFLD